MNYQPFIDDSVSLIEFTRIYLALFYTFVAVFYTYRIIYKNRNTPSGVVFPGEIFCSSWWNHMVFKFFRAAIWLVCVIRLFIPEFDRYLALFEPLNGWPGVMFGNILLSGGFILSMFVHFNMGALWRSGIDPNGPKELKTTGLYEYTRNPMYLGVAAAQIGFFLALPCVFSLICLLVGLTALYRQTKVEEAHLSKCFAEEYEQYKALVPRWL
jgi:protein-S-isoprenylcysteine O-methyltransferase Ste14